MRVCVGGLTACCRVLQGNPVVDLAILYDDEQPADGFRKLPHDLSKGTDKPIYVAFRTEAGEEDEDAGASAAAVQDAQADDGEDAPPATAPARLRPITKLTVSYSSSDVPEGDGWERVARPLVRGDATDVVLWFQRRDVSGAWLGGVPAFRAHSPRKLCVAVLLLTPASCVPWLPGAAQAAKARTPARDGLRNACKRGTYSTASTPPTTGVSPRWWQSCRTASCGCDTRAGRPSGTRP